MKKAEYREFTTTELTEKIASLRGELVSLKMTHAVSPLENPTLITKTRKSVAKLLTELHSRETVA